MKEMYELYDFSSEVTEGDVAAIEKTEQFMLESGMTDSEASIPDLFLEKPIGTGETESES